MRPKIIAAVVVLAVTLVSGPGVGAPPQPGPTPVPNYGPCGDPKTVPAGLLSIKEPTPNKVYPVGPNLYPSGPRVKILVCGPGGPSLEMELQRWQGSGWFSLGYFWTPYRKPPEYNYLAYLPGDVGSYQVRVRPQGRPTWSDWVPYRVADLVR